MSGQTVSHSETDSQEEAARRWVRYHIVTFVAVIGVAAGLVIVDAKISEIIGDKLMPGFRTILLLSVLLAGVGARALLAWRSGTVDLQGRIFLTITGLVLLTGAAFGLSDCLQEVREHYHTREGLRLTAFLFPTDVSNELSNRRGGQSGVPH